MESSTDESTLNNASSTAVSSIGSVGSISSHDPVKRMNFHRQDENDLQNKRRRSSTPCHADVDVVSETSSYHDNCSESSTGDGVSEHTDNNRSLTPEAFNLDNNIIIDISQSPNAKEAQSIDVESDSVEQSLESKTVSIANDVLRHSLKTEDTLILSSDLEPMTSRGHLKASVTQMPSSFCDLETSGGHLKASLTQIPSSLCDLEPMTSGGHLKTSLTRMPSSFCDMRSSMRSNESLQLHHNLTLLLETTRVAISHDEKELEKLDLDIRRLRSKCVIDSVRTERLATRWRNMADIVFRCEEWEANTDLLNRHIQDEMN